MSKSILFNFWHRTKLSWFCRIAQTRVCLCEESQLVALLSAIQKRRKKIDHPFCRWMRNNEGKQKKKIGTDERARRKEWRWIATNPFCICYTLVAARLTATQRSLSFNVFSMFVCVHIKTFGRGIFSSFALLRLCECRIFISILYFLFLSTVETT